MNPVEAVGCRLVLKIDKIIDPVLESARKAGLKLVEKSESVDDEKRRQAGVDQGRIVEIGPSCSQDYVAGIKVGDIIGFAKYAGKMVNPPDDENDKYIIINDEDVVCKFRKKHG